MLRHGRQGQPFRAESEIPATIVICRLCSHKRKKKERIEQGEYGIRKVKEYPTRDILIRDTPFAHPTIMMRKKVYDALGGYRVGHKNMRAEDLDLWIRFFEAGYKGYNIQEVLYRYHESRDDLYKRSVKVAIHTMAAFWYGYRVLNVPFYKRIWVLKPLVAALIPKWIMEKYHRIRLDKV